MKKITGIILAATLTTSTLTTLTVEAKTTYKIKSGKLVNAKTEKIVKGFKTYKKILYKDGKRFTGEYKDLMYKKGEKLSGFFRKILYKNGKKFTGVDDGRLYNNGKTSSGIYEISIENETIVKVFNVNGIFSYELPKSQYETLIQAPEYLSSFSFPQNFEEEYNLYIRFEEWIEKRKEYHEILSKLKDTSRESLEIGRKIHDVDRIFELSDFGENEVREGIIVWLVNQLKSNLSNETKEEIKDTVLKIYPKVNNKVVLDLVDEYLDEYKKLNNKID